MKWDKASLFGLVFGIGGILLGQVLEGGHIGSLVQTTAFFIVFGGTLGAVLISSTQEDLRTAVALFKTAFQESEGQRPEEIIAQITQAAQIARKDSILALEKNISYFSNSYMKKVFRYVVDGVESHTIREVFEHEIELEEEHMLGGAKVWMEAGGFAPTIGIIGAILGLIHVMQNLTDTGNLGKGIAVAFVATIYGVGSANLIFIPIANKIKRKIKQQSLQKELVLEGAISIVSGMNPHIIHEKLNSYWFDKMERK
ncbi:MAG: flagellar motor protein [Pseudomonadota bacterium]|nr:flagellar motor protein [Pseudomonadota bacterium]